MQENYIELNGSAVGIVFRNEENGYTVLRLETSDGGSTTVVGTLPFVAPGEMLTLRGTWVTHPSYGSQFKAETIEYRMPKTENEILQYLASGAIKGIGVATAREIIGRFGDETLRVIAEEPQLLAQIKGISSDKAKQISTAYKKQTALKLLTEFFTEHKISLRYALKLYGMFGEDAPDALRDNPYLLTDEYYGAEFSEADELAQKLGYRADSPERIQAAIIYELRHNSENNGHTYIPMRKLMDATSRMLSIENIADAAEELWDSGDVVVEEINGETAVYLTKYYLAEVYIAERLKRLSNEDRVLSYDPEKLWDQLELGVALSDTQKSAVSGAATRGAFALTGGPGTGKTTTVKAILTLFDRMGLKTALAAPTGRAAKRMSDLCGREAQTVHRLLNVKVDEKSGLFYFWHNETNTMPYDAVILDETSMVDVELMSALLKAMRPTARLIMVGDADQLPSVGPGNIFADILASGVVPTLRLTEVFRQAAESLIIRNAHLINKGGNPVQGEKNDDFFVMTRPNGESTALLTEELCVQRLPKNMNIPPEQIQVLTPTKVNGTGTRALNARLQAVLNPPSERKAEKQFGDVIFREGDRIMQIRNNYELMWEKPDGEIGAGVFNGDVGQITRINTKEQTLEAEFDDRRVAYPFELLNELEPAYAMTVHKSQGSEYRAVILALMNVPTTLLTRSVLYTAVTRAKELLIIVGDRECIFRMVGNDKQRRRYSALKTRLCAPPNATNSIRDC
ncbi:MAG: ATP-dependent RecD-like DNA helicase [Oscillospiraceae bacterium]|jgi:exodeoxyribonuclease V alpha subunit|nr:ATP-dependent RecD-like DNA helicase [Oscillospiraceae bacterium]